VVLLLVVLFPVSFPVPLTVVLDAFKTVKLVLDSFVVTFWSVKSKDDVKSNIWALALSKTLKVT
jgi:hypothetical protein